MPKLTRGMKQVLKRQPVALVATSDARRLLNVSPKGILKINVHAWAIAFGLDRRSHAFTSMYIQPSRNEDGTGMPHRGF